MRQGGMKPKSHSSGTYWIRANANSGNQRNVEDNGSPSINSVLIAIVIITFLVCAVISH